MSGYPLWWVRTSGSDSNNLDQNVPTNLKLPYFKNCNKTQGRTRWRLKSWFHFHIWKIWNPTIWTANWFWPRTESFYFFEFQILVFLLGIGCVVSTHLLSHFLSPPAFSLCKFAYCFEGMSLFFHFAFIFSFMFNLPFPLSSLNVFCFLFSPIDAQVTPLLWASKELKPNQGLIIIYLNSS